MVELDDGANFFECAHRGWPEPRDRVQLDPYQDRAGGYAPSVDDEFLAVADIARILKLNQLTVRNWIDQGSLPKYQSGDGFRMSRGNFDAFVEAGYQRGPSPPRRRTPKRIWDGEAPPPESP